MAAELLQREYALSGKDIKINIETRTWSGWDDFKQAVTLAAESGSAPNIIVSGHEDIGPWAQAGILRPIEDYVDFDAWPLNQLYPNLIDVASYEGQIWGLPQDAEARAFYFSRNHMKAIGYSDADLDALPERVLSGEYTLYSMLDDVKKMQDEGVVEPGNGFAPRVSNGPDYWQFYQSFGGEMVDPETGKLVLDKQALTGMYQFFVDAVDKGVVSPTYLGRDFDDWHRGVVSDRYGAWHGGTFHVKQWESQFGLEDFFGTMQATLIPSGGEGGRANSITHPLVYLLSSEGSEEDAELSAELVTIASEPRINVLHAVKSAHLAIGTAEADIPLYANDRWLGFASKNLLPHANAIPNSADFGAYWTAMFKGLEASWTHTASVEDAVKNVEAEAVSALGDKIVVR
jgi:inositol-phosphate transport system substrate-binding protein